MSGTRAQRQAEQVRLLIATEGIYFALGVAQDALNSSLAVHGQDVPFDVRECAKGAVSFISIARETLRYQTRKATALPSKPKRTLA